ncbi:MAG: M20/M25/M40 family metallo-hydrolase [Methylobacteriaceae bacterium]|nr:M20/M25/M40 family metallo-hydrolase [Methylobacteriaceae bacterium]
MTSRLRALLAELMLIPGPSGRERRVRRRIRKELESFGLAAHTDAAGNLIATIEGTDPQAPSLMLHAHMDQLGLVARKIEPDGYVRFERLGGIPDRALPATPVLFCIGEGRDVGGVIANKSHHATPQEEKFKVVPHGELFIDIGTETAAETRALGIEIGTPIVYAPNVMPLGEHRIAGTSVDDRAGCAVLIEAVRALAAARPSATLHCVFSVLEEFNLRGAMIAAQALKPDIAIQVDLLLAADTPDTRHLGEAALGQGPGISLYNFHGRGTLNGTIPHPSLVALFADAARAGGVALQRAANVGVLTDNSYVQLAGAGIACVDVGFPMRYSHSALEVCDLRDLDGLVKLIVQAVRRIGPGFTLDRDATEP